MQRKTAEYAFAEAIHRLTVM